LNKRVKFLLAINVIDIRTMVSQL